VVPAKSFKGRGHFAGRAPDSDLQKSLSSPKLMKIKNISLLQKVKLGYTCRHPVPLRGALAIATNEGRVAVDAGNALSERHESVRQRRVVLTPQMLASSER
jgi:hypothetical protein